MARPRRARQRDLLKGYGFCCLCPRCASGEEAAREGQRGALVQEDGWLCPQEDCGGVLLDVGYEAALYRAWRAFAPGGEAAGREDEQLGKVQHQPRPRVCQACGRRVDEAGVHARMADLSLAEGLWERGRGKLGRDGDAGAALPLFEAADSQYRQVLTPLSAPVLQVGGSLVQLYIGALNLARARECLLSTAVAAAKAGLHPPGSPGPALDLAMLGKLEMQLALEGGDGMAEAAVRHLGRALGVLAVALGDGSPLVEELRRLRAQVEALAATAIR